MCFDASCIGVLFPEVSVLWGKKETVRQLWWGKSTYFLRDYDCSFDYRITNGSFWAFFFDHFFSFGTDCFLCFNCRRFRLVEAWCHDILFGMYTRMCWSKIKFLITIIWYSGFLSFLIVFSKKKNNGFLIFYNMGSVVLHLRNICIWISL